MLAVSSGHLASLDMVFVFTLEIAQGRQYRIGRGIAQRAERALLNVLRQLLDEPARPACPCLSLYLQDIQHLLCSQAAEGALAAGLARVNSRK